jgi:hypothetical protein
MTDSGMNGLMLKILKSTASAANAAGEMLIVVRRPFASLLDELLKTFHGQKDVQIILERRTGERRTKRDPFPSDRRKGDRRESKPELLEVIFKA